MWWKYMTILNNFLLVIKNYKFLITLITLIALRKLQCIISNPIFYLEFWCFIRIIRLIRSIRIIFSN